MATQTSFEMAEYEGQVPTFSGVVSVFGIRQGTAQYTRFTVDLGDIDPKSVNLEVLDKVFIDGRLTGFSLIAHDREKFDRGIRQHLPTHIGALYASNDLPDDA